MKKRVKILGLIIIAIMCTIALVIKIIPIKNVTRFEAKHNIEKSEYWSFSKEALIGWSKGELIKQGFDVSKLEEELSDLEDGQRLIISFGREISFFYRIRPFKPVEVKFKNDELKNEVYVYKINYDGPIIDYTIY